MFSHHRHLAARLCSGIGTKIAEIQEAINQEERIGAHLAFIDRWSLGTDSVIGVLGDNCANQFVRYSYDRYRYGRSEAI